jgi:CRISPR-associated protein Cas5t
MAGAAMGLSFEESIRWMKENSVHIGCSGKSSGDGKDLWNYIKIKASSTKDEPVTHAIVLRTFLYRLKVFAYYACECGEKMKELYDAFKSPAYAITLGTSDELALIRNVRFYDDVVPDRISDLKNTWLVGDYSRKFKLDWSLVQRHITISLYAPIVKNLPVDYEFHEDGTRRAVKYLPLTFLEEMHILEEDVDVMKFSGDFVSMLKL